MATPTHTNATARKLPIKRKTTQPQSNPNPNIFPSEEDYNNEFDYDDDEEEEEEEEEFHNNNNNNIEPNRKAPPPPPPPFKFHRIWSEPDEIRFLQGLLGCRSQGLAFPRDLNVFYERFSDSMPQPYTRSQLSEKLRRLRKKYRTVSARVARGLDPSRLAPHDRDLLHLCTCLWHPDHASTSPFAAPPADAAGSSPNGTRRRRANPRSSPAAAAAAPPAKNLEPNRRNDPEEVAAAVAAPPAPVATDDGSKGVRYVAAKTVLDAFDRSLEETQTEMARLDDGDDGMARRWREQRVAELDAFARRLRLALEQSFG
ncbi:uncharacterized protein M6B38_283800 [Iris pallida]|uniref:Glabrous enhancer-binding protein-like DBD domain-containing protein n=1 Tax=Iris pallida TaxID=29817 RepID=A0AAX6I1K8_IRIPA|nr:uncharacterized protein M6B38_283800 [Iris pallida]